MSSKEIYKVSVRSIIEFVLREGDIVPGVPIAQRFAEGIRGHQKVQASRGPEYKAEVSVSMTVEGDTCVLEVTGRADGIEETGSSLMLEEIKTTDINLKSIGENDYPMHWIQAYLYAYILNEGNGYKEVEIRLTYYHLQTTKTLSFTRSVSPDELADIWNQVIPPYLKWIEAIGTFTAQREESIDKLSFPYDTFRAGQREMAVSVYNTVRDGERLFIQAPTGIGKTMGVLYPAIKSMRKKLVKKIFYLTAKTIARTVAEDAVSELSEGGLRIKSVTLTAKGKICFLKDEYPDQSPPCEPEICPYAKGHFSRINEALSAIFEEDLITRGVVERYAQEHQVCPFEFSLDISNWADIVICDYNYAFDPRVRLQRFFTRGKGSYAFLVDEAHNLVERGRDMFSARIRKRDVLTVRRIIRGSYPELANHLSKLNSVLLAIKKDRFPDDDSGDSSAAFSPDGRSLAVYEETPPDEIDEPILAFIRAFEWSMKWSRQRIPPVELIDLYFALMAYSRVAEGYDDRFLTLIQATKSNLTIKLSCIDPSTRIDEVLKKGSCAVFFSATLTPMGFYRSLLAGEESSVVTLPSPFPRENLCLLMERGVSTRYRDRTKTYDLISEMVQRVVSTRRGNYLVYFPSYAYMEEIRLRFTSTYSGDSDMKVTAQSPRMDEEERERFLLQFSSEPEGTLVGFAVMGGIFAEGIDLKGERLSGAIVVGVGLPQIGPEREVIKNYFDERNGRGFDYAYTFPGFNRVQQAAGRVIRTETDRGVILLIDDRFSEQRYVDLFPGEWIPPEPTDGPDSISSALADFW